MAKIYDNQKGPKDEWAKLKNEPLKVKLQWLVQYYGLAALCCAVALAVTISIAVTVIINSRPCVVSGEFFSEYADVSCNEAVKEELCSHLGLEAKKSRIDISTITGANIAEDSALMVQRLIARVNAQDIDFIVGKAKVFSDYTDTSDANNCLFSDLTKVLPEKTLKALEEAGRLNYIETDFGTVPFSIDITGTRFYELYKLSSKESFLGIISDTPNMEGVIALIDLYILGAEG